MEARITKTKEKESEKGVDRYIEAVGRRKTAVARVRIVLSTKEHIIVNDENIESYFDTEDLRRIASEALHKSKIPEKYSVSARVSGGGIHSQAEAIRHGISRALAGTDLDLRKKIKKLGFLKRDPRAKERRKFGLKKARKAPQWSKR